MDGIRSKANDLPREVSKPEKVPEKRRTSYKWDYEDNPLPRHTNLKSERAQAYSDGMIDELE